MMATDVSRGVEYLHLSGLLHRDLKTPNLLIDVGNRIKLCDFGLVALTSVSSVGKQVGTGRWMSPEVIRREGYTEAADVCKFCWVSMLARRRAEARRPVWAVQLLPRPLLIPPLPILPLHTCASYTDSVGIILWELLTAEVPYDTMSVAEVLTGVRKHNLRPRLGMLDDDNPYGLLIAQCWATLPSARPHISEVSKKLAGMGTGEGWRAVPIKDHKMEVESKSKGDLTANLDDASPNELREEVRWLRDENKRLTVQCSELRRKLKYTLAAHKAGDLDAVQALWKHK